MTAEQESRIAKEHISDVPTWVAIWERIKNLLEVVNRFANQPGYGGDSSSVRNT